MNHLDNSGNDLCSQNMIPINEKIQKKLDFFLETNKIPHIIFHGSSGTGKRTIVYNFLNKIYKNDKHKIKTNVMFVNCAHGKGIKFIREELKFFAKTNIQSNSGVPFKTIILMNADFLTIDAESALRRCIELFSYNTRFFIIVQNKHKLLNPILSRFCEIHVPDYMENGKVLNLHQYDLKKKFDLKSHEAGKKYFISNSLSNLEKNITHKLLFELANNFYENGISCIDLMNYINDSNEWSKENITKYMLEFYKIKSEFRCEKMLILYILDLLYLRSNNDLNILC